MPLIKARPRRADSPDLPATRLTKLDACSGLAPYVRDPGELQVYMVNESPDHCDFQVRSNRALNMAVRLRYTELNRPPYGAE